jgi:hypothetical protein
LDLFWACGINKDTGNFNVPLADPTHKKRVQQLLNSILRNRINKQTMPGGPVVQVANYGTSKKLAIRFKDRKGNILPTKEEYIAKNM